MPTLVLSPRYSDDSNLLWRTAVQSKWEVLRLQSWQVPPDLQVKDPVFYGEPIFCDLAAGWLGYQLDIPSDFWLARLPFDLVNRNIKYATYHEAQKFTQPKFIKPPINKNFVAKIYYNPSKELVKHVSPEEPVLISDPVEFGLEVRSFIVDRKIHTYSPYSGHWAARSNRYDLIPEEEDGFQEFVQKVIDVTDIPDVYVLDVGKIKDKGWSVIEANPACSSGIYGCDPKKVLEALVRATKKYET